MARPESRFIQKLTKAQVQQLEALRDNGESKQIRQRGQAIGFGDLKDRPQQDRRGDERQRGAEINRQKVKPFLLRKADALTPV